MSHPDRGHVVNAVCRSGSALQIRRDPASLPGLDVVQFPPIAVWPANQLEEARYSQAALR
jgi:hypothetical protein